MSRVPMLNLKVETFGKGLGHEQRALLKSIWDRPQGVKLSFCIEGSSKKLCKNKETSSHRALIQETCQSGAFQPSGQLWEVHI